MIKNINFRILFVLLGSIGLIGLLFILQSNILFVLLSSIFISFLLERFISIKILANLKNQNLSLNEKIEESNSLLNQYKNAVDVSSIVSKSDTKGIITYVNDEFCKISGYTRDELIGKAHSIIRHEDTPDDVFQNLWNTINNKKVFRGVIKNKTKSGTYYYVDSTIVPILNENSDIVEFISIRRDITSLIESEVKIQKQTTDQLTLLPNKQKLIEDIENKDGILARIVILRFREINNYYGYEIGDKVLVEISKRLEQFSTHSIVYKIAGDEFGVFSNDCDINRFITTIEVIIEHFVYNSIIIDDNKFHISLVAGIASGKKSIYHNSEYALQKAIEENKKFVYFDSSIDLQQEFQKNILWTTKIKEAIEEDRITIYAQPIICNTSGEVLKYEVLMRMIDDNKVISPSHFLDIAKKSKLYFMLTKIVIDKAFMFFKDKNLEFSINLTIEDIMNKELIEYLEKRIEQTKIANKLILEIVESEGIERYNDVIEFINKMKSYGCRIAIDDFGTGYSNFEYLMSLNIDFIKIDGSMIKNIHQDKNSQLVVGLIINFAKDMAITTVAEFVHNEDTYKKVKEMGIDYSQGYYLGEPISLNDIKY